MPDNYAEVSAMREKLNNATHTAKELHDCNSEVRLVAERYKDDPHPAIQEIIEILSHYKI